MEKLLEVKDLSFAYGKQKILENINLEVKKKDFFAIIGPNGGGKSTLLETILGFNTPDNGTIELLGKKNQEFSQIGYVPQNTNVNINFPIKVIEVVMMGHKCTKRSFFGYSKSEMACAMNSLKEVGMQEYANKKIGSLSGGQRQRVMIARALCSSPKILFLDEPTSSIDVKWQKEIYELLKKLNEQMSIVVVSHDISVTLEYANKVAYINKNIVTHDLKEIKETLSIKDGHFCEVELLQVMAEHCRCCT